MAVSLVVNTALSDPDISADARISDYSQVAHVREKIPVISIISVIFQLGMVAVGYV